MEDIWSLVPLPNGKEALLKIASLGMALFWNWQAMSPHDGGAGE